MPQVDTSVTTTESPKMPVPKRPEPSIDRPATPPPQAPLQSGQPSPDSATAGDAGARSVPHPPGVYIYFATFAITNRPAAARPATTHQFTPDKGLGTSGNPDSSGKESIAA